MSTNFVTMQFSDKIIPFLGMIPRSLVESDPNTIKQKCVQPDERLDLPHPRRGYAARFCKVSIRFETILEYRQGSQEVLME